MVFVQRHFFSEMLKFLLHFACFALGNTSTGCLIKGSQGLRRDPVVHPFILCNDLNECVQVVAHACGLFDRIFFFVHKPFGFRKYDLGQNDSSEILSLNRPSVFRIQVTKSVNCCDCSSHANFQRLVAFSGEVINCFSVAFQSPFPGVYLSKIIQDIIERLIILVKLVKHFIGVTEHYILHSQYILFLSKIVRLSIAQKLMPNLCKL